MTRGRRSRFIPRRLPARFLLAAVFVSAVQGCSTPGRVFPDDPAAWQRQFLADYPKDGTAAAHDLAVIAERWPDRLSQFPDATIAYVLAQTSAGPQAQFDLLRQLYAAHWTLQCGIEPSGFWLKYVQQLVARGDLELARDVVKHIREPRDVLILRVDRRYIALAAADPALPTVEQAAIQSIDDARAAAQRCPRSVEVMENLLAAMLAAGHDEDVLTSDDEFLDELARSPHSFQDAYLGLHSLLNARASAFVALGR